MCWSRSTATTSRSTASRRSTRATGWTCHAGCSLGGSAGRRCWWSRWRRSSGATPYRARGFMPMIRRCRCSRPARAGRRRQGSGPICATIGRSAGAIRLRYSTSSRQTGRASTRSGACATSVASCRPTRTQGSTRFTRAAAWSRRRAGRMRGATSTTSCWPMAARSRARRSSACSRCSPSRPRSMASRRRRASKHARPARRRRWPTCTPGCRRRCGGSPANPTWPRPSATPWRSGER